ncbi:Asg7p KNAG_0C02400 [Huiozyma naganishii CBS 8797]|uniref:Uncharacterized protein n=1 Tax=Huiozyma naganishii (strain ATCC MYA-139 / BCRC 22969 / CBS 8797 / KCTC 17520 / NBRC 10181 / NCYC 3082 / Yp74L-3) TaxID=1071383 RepID=J7S5S6_HUIN7|nr:hypothetical protein KNAG_0C02400 [Kazachstania naganishii CBS 8797]CCK69351.1 hypothetical protein KNAG_0C02400 [Kazachstania naganishii CBS 8797]
MDSLQTVMDEAHEQGQEKYLVAPFEDFPENHSCECPSCQRSSLYYHYPIRLFLVGLIFPLASICNVGLYIWCQFYLDHRVAHPPLSEYDYPTQYEASTRETRSHFKLSESTWQETELMNGSELSLSGNEETVVVHRADEDPHSDNDVDSDRALQTTRYRHLKEVVEEVVGTHVRLRKHYTTWMLRTLCSLAGQTIAIVLLSVLLTKRA